MKRMEKSRDERMERRNNGSRESSVSPVPETPAHNLGLLRYFAVSNYPISIPSFICK